MTAVRVLCETTYFLHEELRVPEQLERLQKQYDEAGANERAREQEQVWDAVIQLFDEMVEMVGEESMKLSTFRATLKEGLEYLSFRQVQPGIVQSLFERITVPGLVVFNCLFF